VIEVVDAIKYYIRKNPDAFFPKKCRERFHKLAHLTSNTPIADCLELKDIFKNINIENKSRILYILDHILESVLTSRHFFCWFKHLIFLDCQMTN
jgi:hypothetical protein